MPHRSVPPGAPPGLCLRLLGSDGWLTDRRFYLAGDGSVWCREASCSGFVTPRWRAVGPEEQAATVLRGWTLAQLAATVAAPPEDEPTDRERKRPPAPITPA
jgi:hypothetical protein